MGFPGAEALCGISVSLNSSLISKKARQVSSVKQELGLAAIINNLGTYLKHKVCTLYLRRDISLRGDPNCLQSRDHIPRK